jgi:hypothetical protein
MAMMRAAITGPVRVVIGLRSEFLDDLQALPALAGAHLGGYLLGPLGREALIEAIEGPARIAGYHLARDLAPALVADTGDGDALPLLAFTLHALADGHRRGDTLTIADYERTGRVHGALSTHANTALRTAVDHSGLSRSAVLAALSRLAAVDAGRTIRRPVDLDSLDPARRTALDVFVDARLLTITTDTAGTTWLGPTHEALLTAWPPLADVLITRAAAAATARILEQAATDWHTAGRTTAYLWTGDRLTTATATLAGGPDQPGIPENDLTDTARSFLAAARAHANILRQRDEAIRRQQRRRHAITITSSATVAVLALLAGLTVLLWTRASNAGHLPKQAELVVKVNALVRALAQERYASSSYINSGYLALAGETAASRAPVDQAYAEVRSVAGSLPDDTRLVAAVNAAETQTDKLTGLRRQIDAHSLKPGTGADVYNGMVRAWLGVTPAQSGVGTTDPEVARTIAALTAISNVAEQSAQQRSYVSILLILRRLDPDNFGLIRSASGAEAARVSQFDVYADQGQRQLYDQAVGPTLGPVTSLQDRALRAAQTGATVDVTDTAWLPAANAKVDQLRNVEAQIATALTDRAGSLASSARTSAWIASGATALAITLTVTLSALVTFRSARQRRAQRVAAVGNDAAGIGVPSRSRHRDRRSTRHR